MRNKSFLSPLLFEPMLDLLRSELNYPYIVFIPEYFGCTVDVTRQDDWHKLHCRVIVFWDFIAVQDFSPQPQLKNAIFYHDDPSFDPPMVVQAIINMLKPREYEL